MDRTLEKLLSRQKDSGVSISAPILEINAGHPLLQALAKSATEKGAASIEDAAQLLLDQAFIIEGEQVPDPAAFAKRMADVMAKVFA
jgi:molecular chaperone HtpG